MSDYQKRIATLLDEINKKTYEVERLTKEETYLIEKEEDNNNCSELIVVLTEIVTASEHYEATQTAVTDAQKINNTKQKLWSDEKASAAETAMMALSEQDKQNYDCIDNLRKRNATESGNLKSYHEYKEAAKALQESKLKEYDARQKYESTLRKLFKPYLIEAQTNIEWKRANSEMIDVMLNQISVLQTMYQQETKARDVMLNQISVLQTWYQQEIKAREEKRITNVWKFRLFYGGLGIGAILLMNYNFNYPFINVSAPTGYLAMY